jgi:predicted benzoate:H+ symporter BenE
MATFLPSNTDRSASFSYQIVAAIFGAPFICLFMGLKFSCALRGFAERYSVVAFLVGFSDMQV